MHAFLKSQSNNNQTKPTTNDTKQRQAPHFKVDFIKDGVLFDSKNKDPSRPSIPDFFKGRDVFITGGTGFLGKVLIEKLIRSCPGINRIFVLMRGRRGQSVQERLQDLKNLPVNSVFLDPSKCSTKVFDVLAV